MRCCAPTATLPRWIFPRAISYRHAIEDLARGSGHTEIEVALLAIAAAKRAAPTGPGRDAATVRREQDPGYYLISRGRPAVEQGLGFRAPLSQWIARASAAAGIPGYLGTIAVVNAFFLALVLCALAHYEVSGWTLFVLAILAALPAMDAAVALVNRVAAASIGPAPLPGLELRDGVPAESAHDGRRAHAADDTGGTRGADRAPGSSLPGESGRRPSFRTALGLDRFRHRERAGRRRAARRRRGRDRAAEPALRPAAPDGARFLLLHRRRTGTRPKESGWAGSASAASCTS